MSTEMDPGQVSEQLRHEFDLMGMAPGLVTAEVVAAGRRRRRNRLLKAGAASVAVLTAVAIGVPAVLHARADRPAVRTADAGSGPWERCTPEDWVKTQEHPPGYWRSTIVGQLRKTVEAKLREVSPGITLEYLYYMGGACSPREYFGSVAFNVVRADGMKGALEVSLTRDPGDPADRAAEVVRTSRRETARGEMYRGGPQQVPADKPREQRTLDAGVHAVVYGKGVDRDSFPVDVIAPGDLTVTVDVGPYRPPTGPPGEVHLPKMDASNSPFSLDEMLEIGAAVAALR